MRYPVNHISISNGFHEGKSIDFGWWKNEYKGQDIMACDNGTIYKIENQTNGGNVIFIKHDNGYVSCYGHLDKISVNIGQRVAIGQKIGTMGSTGKVTGQHLHFGIYSNDKNIHGKADIDPFSICYVYKDQEVRTTGTTKNYLNKFKYYEDKETWKSGDYKLLFVKAVRKSHNLGLNVAKVKDLQPATRKYLTSKNLNADAKLIQGAECKISEIYNQNGRIWGKYGKFWIVLCNIDGTPQAKRI